MRLLNKIYMLQYILLKWRRLQNNQAFLYVYEAML